MFLRCPCCSGKIYEQCCKLYHDGKLPENAEILMRSRYSAYAKQLPDYLMATTHPLNPSYTVNTVEWKEKILDFATKTTFEKLEILEFNDGKETAFVTFKAYLSQNGRDVSFTEKSKFEKVTNKWLYHSGILKEGVRK